MWCVLSMKSLWTIYSYYVLTQRMSRRNSWEKTWTGWSNPFRKQFLSGPLLPLKKITDFGGVSFFHTIWENLKEENFPRLTRDPCLRLGKLGRWSTIKLGMTTHTNSILMMFTLIMVIMQEIGLWVTVAETNKTHACLDKMNIYFTCCIKDSCKLSGGTVAMAWIGVLWAVD